MFLFIMIIERDGTECGAEHASSVNSLCTESSPKTGNTYSNGVLTGSSCAANVVHVHISGSRNKLGHDLKARRRATRKKRKILFVAKAKD